jgi:hypothetical protein
MNYNDFARAVEQGLFPREYTYWGLGNEGRNFNMEDMYKNYKIAPTEPMRNPQLLREYQEYRTRFPQGTDEQFMNLLRRNRPDLLNYANQSFTAENLARSARLRNIGKIAGRLLSRGLRAIGPVGDIIHYGTLPMRKDEILKEYNMYIDDNGNITGRV